MDPLLAAVKQPTQVKVKELVNSAGEDQLLCGLEGLSCLQVVNIQQHRNAFEHCLDHADVAINRDALVLVPHQARLIVIPDIEALEQR